MKLSFYIYNWNLRALLMLEKQNSSLLGACKSLICLTSNTSFSSSSRFESDIVSSLWSWPSCAIDNNWLELATKWNNYRKVSLLQAYPLWESFCLTGRQLKATVGFLEKIRLNVNTYTSQFKSLNFS